MEIKYKISKALVENLCFIIIKALKGQSFKSNQVLQFYNKISSIINELLRLKV